MYQYGCDDEPTQLAVWGDEEDQFFNCPRKFVSDETIDFCETLSFYKDVPGSCPRYGELSNRFVEAHKTYTAYYNKFYGQRLKRDSAGQQTTDGLETLRKSFNGRKRTESKSDIC